MLVVRPVREVTVLERLEHRYERPRSVEAFNTGHDIDHRLGRQPWHSGAADVLDRSGHIIADCQRQGFAFFLEPLRPGRVVGHDVNLSVGRHTRVSAGIASRCNVLRRLTGFNAASASIDLAGLKSV